MRNEARCVVRPNLLGAQRAGIHGDFYDRAIQCAAGPTGRADLQHCADGDVRGLGSRQQRAIQIKAQGTALVGDDVMITVPNAGAALLADCILRWLAGQRMTLYTDLPLA